MVHCLETMKRKNEERAKYLAELRKRKEIEEEIVKYEYFFGPDQWDSDGVDHVERIKETKKGYLKDMGDGTYACIRPE